MAGGVERVLTLKANYFAEHYGYDVTIILTEGADKPLFYPLSDKVKVVNLNIGFEEMWNVSFVKKVLLYLTKQRQFRKKLTAELMRLRPDITISLLRREINFITRIKDGSKKIGEMHLNRANYRTPKKKWASLPDTVFSWFWMRDTVSKLRRLDRLVVLTEKDKESWTELNNVLAIPNPMFDMNAVPNVKQERRVIAVGRYSHEKGYDNLLMAWSMAQKDCQDWRLEVFGDGDRTPYEQLMKELRIDSRRCILNGRTAAIQEEYSKSMLAVCSSRFEGFGMAILEAMSCGLPVVSFDCPWGPRTIISDGEDGVLVENGNVVKLATELIRLMQDDNLRQRMSQIAKGNTQWYNLAYIAEMWKSLFEALTEA